MAIEMVTGQEEIVETVEVLLLVTNALTATKQVTGKCQKSVRRQYESATMSDLMAKHAKVEIRRVSLGSYSFEQYIK